MAEEEVGFEAALAELETIVQLLERGQPTLAESLERFERGVLLLRRCRAELDRAEAKIQEFVEFDEQGIARLKTFEHEATASDGRTSGDAKPPSKRSAGSRAKPDRPPAPPADDGTLF